MATYDELREQLARLTSSAARLRPGRFGAAESSTPTTASGGGWAGVITWVATTLIPWLLKHGKKAAEFWSKLTPDEQTVLKEFVAELVRNPLKARDVDSEKRAEVVRILRKGFGIGDDSAPSPA